MIAMLGARADALSDRGAEVFLDAARSALAALLAERRFDRDGALDLLAIDALMTFAYEHAAEHVRTIAELDALTRRGVALVAPLAPSHG